MYKIANLIWLPIQLSLKQPFKTAQQYTTNRELTLIKLTVVDTISHLTAVGIGEVQSFTDFGYALENQRTSREIITSIITPFIKTIAFHTPIEFADQLANQIPHGSFAKAGVEMAVWDAIGQLTQQSLREMVNGINLQVPVGIALGVNSSPTEIKQAMVDGYRRIKLKITPEVLRQLKAQHYFEHFPEQKFSLDANGSFAQSPNELLYDLPQNICFIEQPFTSHDFVRHAAFQAKTKQVLSLDESINNLDDIKTLIALQAAQAVTIKQGKIGGITAALRAIKLCHQAGIRPWVGGMLSSNIGRAVDLALASLPEIAFPSDISDSQRYFEKDVSETSFTQENGFIAVPNQPGIGIKLYQEIDDRLAF